MLSLYSRDVANCGKYKQQFNGRNLYASAFKAKDAAGISNADIEKITRQYSKTEYRKGVRGTCVVSALYNIGWRSGHITKIGASTEAFDPDNFKEYEKRDEGFDYNEKAKEFRIIFIPGGTLPSPSGGSGEFNDCLFDAIKSMLGDKMPKAIDTGKKMKDLCGLKRKSKIHHNHLKTIEEVLKDIATLNCTGTGHHTGKYWNNVFTINLYLCCGHYSLSIISPLPTPKGVSFVAKTVEDLYTYSHGDGFVSLYDGKEIIEVYPEELTALRKTYKFLFVQMNKKGTLESTYDEFIINQKKMFDMSDKKVDMFKYPTVAKAAMDIWQRMSPFKELPPRIGLTEGDYLDKTFTGGIRYSNKGYTGPYHLYDINSQYPSIMIDKSFNVPVKPGCCEILTELPKIFRYGMYRCTVAKHEDENVNKLFKFNSNNFYTHHDLKIATRLKMTLTLEEGVNFYFYDRIKCLKSGLLIFGPFINEMYEYKKEFKPFKQIMNCLYGSLCERDRKTKVTNINIEDNTEFEILHSLCISGNTMTINYSLAGADPFVSSYARMGVFLTSFARYRLVNLIIDNELAPLIERIHTDSLLTTEDISDKLNISDKIGDFKLEHSGTCTIVNGNTVKYNKDAKYLCNKDIIE